MYKYNSTIKKLWCNLLEVLVCWLILRILSYTYVQCPMVCRPNCPLMWRYRWSWILWRHAFVVTAWTNTVMSNQGQFGNVIIIAESVEIRTVGRYCCWKIENCWMRKPWSGKSLQTAPSTHPVVPMGAFLRLSLHPLMWKLWEYNWDCSPIQSCENFGCLLETVPSTHPVITLGAFLRLALPPVPW